MQCGTQENDFSGKAVEVQIKIRVQLIVTCNVSVFQFFVVTKVSWQWKMLTLEDTIEGYIELYYLCNFSLKIKLFQNKKVIKIFLRNE